MEALPPEKKGQFTLKWNRTVLVYCMHLPFPLPLLSILPSSPLIDNEHHQSSLPSLRHIPLSTVAMMSLKTRVKSHLRKAITPLQANPPRSGASCMGALARLPVELLKSIINLLPTVDIICFSLCNHRICELVLGQGANRRYRIRITQTVSLLNRLERDLPKYFACDNCLLLHRYDGSEGLHLRGFRYATRWRSCVLNDTKPDAVLRTHALRGVAQISFLQLKLAVKRLQSGPESGISTDSLSHTSVRCYPKASNRPEMTWLFSMEAQACPHPFGLYIRMQDVVLFETREEFLSQARYGYLGTFLWRLEVCLHKPLIDLATPFVRSLHDGQEASFTYTCHVCRTNAQFDFGEFDSKFAMTMTRWAYPGSGPTRRDPAWMSHLTLAYIPDERLLDGLDLSRHLPKAQKARLRFEKSAPQSFEEIRSRNLSYLKDQEYKRIMPFNARDSFWHIQYKDPSVNRMSNFLWSLLGRSKKSWQDEVFDQKRRGNWLTSWGSWGSSSDMTSRFLVANNMF